jgi:hypothetical protein
MRRYFLAVLVINVALILRTAQVLAAPLSPQAGQACLKAGIMKTYKGKRYTCIKSGKKLIWNKGVTVVKKRPTPTSSPSQSTLQEPNMDSPELKKYETSTQLCKLLDYTTDGRRAFSSVGFPMVKERLKSKGMIRAIFVAVDFSDIPSKETFASQLDPFGLSAKNFFEYISNKQISWSNEYLPGIIRLDKPSYDYQINRNTVDVGKTDYVPIRKELISKIEDKGVDISTYDLVAFVPPRFSMVGGPAFPESTNSPIMSKYGPILNSVFFAWFFPPEYMVAHEIGHLLGLQHIDNLQVKKSMNDLSTSGWDVMANDASVMSYFGWHKWLLGWIKDDQVTCLSAFPKSRFKLRLNQIDSYSKSRKLLVLPLSTSKAIVVESRRSNQFDVAMPTRTSVIRTERDFGVITYLVDTSKGWEDGTIEIMGNPPRNNWNQKMGLHKGEKIRFNDMELTVVDSDSDGDWIEISSP